MEKIGSLRKYADEFTRLLREATAQLRERGTSQSSANSDGREPIGRRMARVVTCNVQTTASEPKISIGGCPQICGRSSRNDGSGFVRHEFIGAFGKMECYIC